MGKSKNTKKNKNRVVNFREGLLLISIISIILISSFLFLSFVDFNSYKAPWVSRGAQRTFQTYVLPLYLVLIVLAVLPISYYATSKKLEDKIEKNMRVITKLVNKKGMQNKPKKSTAFIDKELIFKFLNPSEKKIIEKLVENKGKVLQAEISRMDSMNKLKTHRAVKDLELKGIIKTEAYGKTRKITLSKDVRDVLQINI